LVLGRLTGSELLFRVLDELSELAENASEDVFVKNFIVQFENVLNGRPASMATINALRALAEYIFEKGVTGLSEYIKDLKNKYDNALWKSAEVASRRVDNGDVILTNSNSLAVKRFLKTLRDQDKYVELVVPESRPGNEGLLLAEYAESLGYDVRLITDSATRFFMKDVDKVFVGAEAIAANGAVVSKVGTSLVALVAKEARKRVFVIAPTAKFSYETVHGELLKLPEGGLELLVDMEKEALPEGFRARVPLYDVTPAEYIDAIATEFGIVAPQAIPILLRVIYGTYPPKVEPLSNLLRKLREKYSLGDRA